MVYNTIRQLRCGVAERCCAALFAAATLIGFFSELESTETTNSFVVGQLLLVHLIISLYCGYQSIDQRIYREVSEEIPLLYYGGISETTLTLSPINDTVLAALF